MRILLAEDDEKLNETLVYGLTQAGFIVDACFDGEDGKADLPDRSEKGTEI